MTMRPLLLLGLLAVCMSIAAHAADGVIESPTNVESVAFSSDGRSLLGLCADGKLRSWNAATGKLHNETAPYSGDSLSSNRVGYSVQAGLIASSQQKGEIMIRELTGGITKSLKSKNETVRNLILSADGKLLAGVNPDRRESGRYTTVGVWDLDSGKQKFAAGGGLGGFGAVEFSPDGRFVVGAFFDTDLRVWSTRDGELVRTIEELPAATFALAFSPDGRRVAAAGADGIVYLIDTSTWKIANKLMGQPETIRSIAYSRDGRILATGGAADFQVATSPATILFWDASTGAELHRIPTALPVGSISFSPDGALVATSHRTKEVHLRALPKFQAK